MQFSNGRRLLCCENKDSARKKIQGNTGEHLQLQNMVGPRSLEAGLQTIGLEIETGAVLGTL